MADQDGGEASGTTMKITVKTPKEKKEIETKPDSGIKEVYLNLICISFAVKFRSTERECIVHLGSVGSTAHL